MADIDRIIDRLGGADAAARLTGVGLEAVRKWRQTHSIPSRHWPAVIAATGLALSDLAGTTPPSKDTSVARSSELPEGATAALVLADGGVFWGRGFGAPTGASLPIGEVCFSTGMTGYQETLTDPSFAGQIITYTFPHIGNVGVNPADDETTTIAARGIVVKQDVTAPSSWRATQPFDAWLRSRGDHGHRGCRYAGADAPHSGRRRAERGARVSPRWPVRCRCLARASRALAGLGGDGSRQIRLMHTELCMG